MTTCCTMHNCTIAFDILSLFPLFQQQLCYCDLLRQHFFSNTLFRYYSLQLLNGVHDKLNSTAGGLLGTVMDHVTHLGDTLSHLKDTAANLLAQGQEGLAGLTSTAHEYVSKYACILNITTQF